MCGCGADSDDLSGLAADTAAAKIDDGEVFSLAGSLRTNEPNCTKNPVQPSGESISYLCRVHLLVGVNAMNATVEVVCNPEKRLCAVYERWSPINGGVMRPGAQTPPLRPLLRRVLP